MRQLDVINLGAADDRPAPVMPSACESGGCGGSEAPPSDPIDIGGDVMVDGVLIDEQAIAREMQHHPADSPEEAWLQSARALAVRQLLLRETGAEEAQAEAAIQALLEKNIEAAQPGEAECRRLYDADPSRFAAPELLEAGHILIEPEEDSPGALHRAHMLAEKLIAEIDGDCQAFAAAARQYSGCPSGKQDGSLGQVRRGELSPDIEAALSALTDGEISPQPVQSRHGWHILFLNRRIPGKPLPFDLVKDRIAEMLEARSWTMEAARYIAGLARKYPVTGIDLQSAAS